MTIVTDIDDAIYALKEFIDSDIHDLDHKDIDYVKRGIDLILEQLSEMKNMELDLSHLQNENSNLEDRLTESRGENDELRQRLQKEG